MSVIITQTHKNHRKSPSPRSAIHCMWSHFQTSETVHRTSPQKEPRKPTRHAKTKGPLNAAQLSESARSDFKQHQHVKQDLKISSSERRSQFKVVRVWETAIFRPWRHFLDERSYERELLSVWQSHATLVGVTRMYGYENLTNTSGAFGFASVMLVFQETRTTATKIWMNFSLVSTQILCSQCLWKLWKLSWAVVFGGTSE